MNSHICLGRGYNENYGSNVLLKVNTFFSLQLQSFSIKIIEHILLAVEKGSKLFHEI